MVIKRKRPPKSRNFVIKIKMDPKCQGVDHNILDNIKVEEEENKSPECPSTSSALPLCSQDNGELQKNSDEVENVKRSNEFSQIKLITMASGSILTNKDTDNLWTKSRSLLRKNNNEMLKAKVRAEYYRNNFHLSLKEKWSKVMTSKISALAFSRSLQGRKVPTHVS